MLRDVAAKLLREQLPVEKLRRLVAADPEAAYERGERPPWDEDLWRRSIELGWPALAVPTQHGGHGFRLVGIAGLMEQVGRHALPSPLVATLNATLVLREARGEGSHGWLARIADGLSASLAISDASGSWEPEDCGVTARETPEGVVLEGAAHFVQDAFKAEAFVTSARCGQELLLCAVPRGACGLELRQDHIHDLTRDQATLRFDGVRVAEADLVDVDAASALRRAWPGLLVVVAADLCGCSEWQLQTTVRYAQQRVQFDRPLGFFQAVKHPLVDAMVAIDRGRALVYAAAAAVDAGAEDALRLARMAKSAASDAGAFVSGRSVQLHGGVGFTWEYDVHLFFKRSLHNQALYGDGVHQRRKLAELLIGPLGGGPDPGAAQA
jgi:alkylation response protein AidB-like acyl-CoA dehydrogenase